MRKTKVLFPLYLLLSPMMVFSNDYIYNKYDGQPFGADGMPNDCYSQRYVQDKFFAGNGQIMCEFAKQLNQTVILTSLTAFTAVIMKQGAFCGFKLSPTGSASLSFISDNYPKTWELVRTEVMSDPSWGKIKKSDCDYVRLSDSQGLFQP